jgi:hypothetical protein
MPEGDFDDLLKRLPAVAKVVNAFTSEVVQQQAFEALVSALQGVEPRHAADRGGGRRRTTSRRKRQPDTDGSPDTKGKSRQARRGGPAIDKNLNLRPKTGKSFRDFAALKNPKTAFEKNVVAVHWLKSAGVKTIGPDQVYTCYKDAAWRIPTGLYNSLAVTASKKGWLNTADMNQITVTTQGENLIDHDLPRKKKE